jgi:hypothetical protein
MGGDGEKHLPGVFYIEHPVRRAVIPRLVGHGVSRPLCKGLVDVFVAVGHFPLHRHKQTAWCDGPGVVGEGVNFPFPVKIRPNPLGDGVDR